MARPGEDELIRRFFAPLAGPGALELTDDAASLTPPPGHDLVLTTDALVAGIHFRPDDPPADIGWKALAVNLSDLAAKGADPLGFLLSLALPADWTAEWLGAFAAGLGALAEASGCRLLGGDTVRADRALTLSITAIGVVPEGGIVRRTTARPGDLLAVTGTIGDAVLGLALGEAEPPAFATSLSEVDRAFLLDRYRRPQARTAFAAAIRAHASAAMDVSDGLAGDCAKMLRVSGVGGTLDLDRVPVSPAGAAALRADPSWRDRMVSGGDDYEILLTAPADGTARLGHEAARLGLLLTVLGEVGREGEDFRLREGGVDTAGPPGSFSHF